MASVVESREKPALYPSSMVTKDDVGVESLQAQVDMAMSFAHNLVTSWIKPSQVAQLRSSAANVTSILEEELRRPPRLGVGASVPTMPSLAHEASGLKRRLRGKWLNSRGVTESQPQDPPKSDDEEHKGRPAKRKKKVDPFGHEGSKKKRKPDLEANPHPSVEHDAKSPVSLSNGSILGPLINDSPSEKKQQQVGPDDQQPVSPIIPPPSETPRRISAPAPGITGAGSIELNAKADKAELLGLPLLNLDGPPEFIDKPGESSKMNSSLKRKRRRRKKKKPKMIAGTGDNPH